VRKALRKAGHARDHVLVAKSASELLVAVGLTSGRVEEAASLIDLATAAVGQAGNADDLRGQLLNNIGVVHMLQENYQQARQDWEEGLAVWQRALGPDHPDVLKTVINLGSAYSRLGDNLEAIKYQNRVIKAQQDTLGPDHPALAISLHNLGIAQGLVGHYEEKRVAVQRALRIDEMLGPDHPNVSRDLQTLAVAMKSLKRPEEALLLDQRAVAIAEKVLGANHPDTSRRLWNLAETLGALGRHDEELVALKRVFAIQKTIHGPASAQVANAHLDLSKFFLARKRMREAWAEADTARQIAEKSAPKELANSLMALAEVRRAQRRRAAATQLLVQAVAVDARSPGDKSEASGRLRSLAELYAEAGKLERAIATYERALALWDKEADAPGERGEIHFSFAKAIAAKDRTRADALAKTAREELASPLYADKRAEVDKWLAGR
jgi:tetratricopeptide (TPR) repeat protein